MANRLNAPNQFEALSPPWILSQLDTNFTQNQAAWNDSSLGFINGICTDTGSANAYVVTAGNLPYGAPSSYNPGMTIFLIPANTNTTSSTITVGSLGSAAILTPAGNALLGGEIAKNRMLGMVYNNASPVGFRIIAPCPVNIIAGGLSGNTTIECAGATSVTAFLTWTVAGTASITLNHLAQGVPINITALNSTGSTFALLVAATDPGGTSFTTINAVLAFSGSGTSFINLLSGGLALSSGLGLKFSGAAPGPLTLFLSI